MKNFVIPILVLTLICLVITGALAVMNHFTAPVIEAAALIRADNTMIEMIPEATGFIPLDISGLPEEISGVYATENNVGYIFIISVHGFSGDITVMCAIAPDGSIITSNTFAHTETQGIGTILDEEGFVGQFDGKTLSTYGDVATVSGATISTLAYIRAIRAALEAGELIIN